MNGLLLINLGTPDAPTPGAVRRYLREFLSDPRVLDIHPIGRAALLNLAILPFRSPKSADAYKKIWTDQGSPLRFHSEALTHLVRERLTDGWAVELGMRYGSPSIGGALDRLRAAGADRIVVFPLYPQYSAASTGSSIIEVFDRLRSSRSFWVTPSVSVIDPFYDDPAFLHVFELRGRQILAGQPSDHVLFSFHGLPERHMRKADASAGHCLASESCCDEIGADNRHCYRAQCYATARGVATRLALADGAWSVSFQSRLGRTPWISPYTDHVIPELARRGIKTLAVFCPAFVADCLETLEEIGIRARRDFLAAGGQSLTLVPSLNAMPEWADAVVQMVHRQAVRFDVKGSPSALRVAGVEHA
jgi:ferrochelatase